MSVRILVVDDSRLMRNMISDVIKNAGFEVCGEATDGIEAVRKYEELQPDLVTMDIVMPKVEDVDGIEAVRRIMEIDSGAKIIMVSSRKQQDLVIQAIELGAKDFIIKPFTEERFTEIVKNTLSE